MSDDNLQNLIRTTDEMIGPPKPINPGLAQRVRHRATRQRHTKVASLSAAAVLALALAINLNPKPAKSPPPARPPRVAAVAATPPVDVARLYREIELLRYEADARAELIAQARARMDRQRRLAHVRYQLATVGDPLDEIDEQIEKAAGIIVHYADRKLNQLDLKESALADYRRVIQRFGQTYWAQVARQRLEENIQI